MKKKIAFLTGLLLSAHVLAETFTCKGFPTNRTAKPNITQDFEVDSQSGEVTSVTTPGKGASFHHVIPSGAFITIVNDSLQSSAGNAVVDALSMQIEKTTFNGIYNEPETKNDAIAALKLIRTTSPDRLIFDKDSDASCVAAPFMDERLVNGFEKLTDYVGYNPANGFNGPPPEERGWDPGEGFDTWGEYFMSENKYKKIHTLWTSRSPTTLAWLLNSSTKTILMTQGTDSNWKMITKGFLQGKYIPRELLGNPDAMKRFMAKAIQDAHLGQIKASH